MPRPCMRTTADAEQYQSLVTTSIVQGTHANVQDNRQTYKAFRTELHQLLQTAPPPGKYLVGQ